MVKGTNRTVIEINDTGNKMFEKVILFVSAEYGNISTKRLRKESELLLDSYSEKPIMQPKTIRKLYKKKRVVAYVASGLLGIGIIVGLIILF